MSNEPMPITDERLAEINDLKASVAFDGIHVAFDESTAWLAILDLRREVERQRAVIAEQQAEIAAMRPVVTAVATSNPLYYSLYEGTFCMLCTGYMPGNANTPEASALFPHEADCRVTQARAYVAQHPATGDGE